MQSQTFQKLNRIVFKILAVLIKSDLIRPYVMEHICSTGLIRVNRLFHLHVLVKVVFNSLHIEFWDAEQSSRVKQHKLLLLEMQ